MFWLNIFIPGHTRGAYGTVGGCCEDKAEVNKVSSCCAAKSTQSKESKPTEDQKRRCVVCHIAKGYTVATVYAFDLTLSGRVLEVIDTFKPQVTTIAFEFPFYPVGPPAV